jgi:hypothetical protein
LKAPGTKRSKLEYDKLLSRFHFKLCFQALISSFAFKSDLRRYSMGLKLRARAAADGARATDRASIIAAARGAQALLTVGRCRSTLSNPR